MHLIILVSQIVVPYGKLYSHHSTVVLGIPSEETPWFVVMTVQDEEGIFQKVYSTVHTLVRF